MELPISLILMLLGRKVNIKNILEFTNKMTNPVLINVERKLLEVNSAEEELFIARIARSESSFLFGKKLFHHTNKQFIFFFHTDCDSEPSATIVFRLFASKDDAPFLGKSDYFIPLFACWTCVK